VHVIPNISIWVLNLRQQDFVGGGGGGGRSPNAVVATNAVGSLRLILIAQEQGIAYQSITGTAKAIICSVCQNWIETHSEKSPANHC
jgi:hypothetical protein